MSVRASSWVWEYSQAEGAAFVVLLSLADHAGAEGGDAWPSVQRIAERCRISVRTAQYALRELAESGEVVIRYKKGPHGTNLYRLVMGGADSAPPQDLHGAKEASGGANQRAQVVQLVAPEPKEEPLLEPRSLSDAELAQADPDDLTPSQLRRQIELSQGEEPLRTFQ